MKIRADYAVICKYIKLSAKISFRKVYDRDRLFIIFGKGSEK